MYFSYFPSYLKYSKRETGFNLHTSVLSVANFVEQYEDCSLPSEIYNSTIMHFIYKIKFETILHKIIKVDLRAYKAVSPFSKFSHLL